MNFRETRYATGHQEDHIKFVELLCDYRSDLNKEKNFDERLDEAATISGVGEDPLNNEEIKKIIHNYLSFYQYHNKFSLLFNYQVTLWRISKLFLNEVDSPDAETLTKTINFLDKMTDLSSKLEQRIENLYSEIYGDDKVIAIAKDQIKKNLTPEQRLKNKRKEKEKSDDNLMNP